MQFLGRHFYSYTWYRQSGIHGHICSNRIVLETHSCVWKVLQHLHIHKSFSITSYVPCGVAHDHPCNIDIKKNAVITMCTLLYIVYIKPYTFTSANIFQAQKPLANLVYY